MVNKKYSIVLYVKEICPANLTGWIDIINWLQYMLMVLILCSKCPTKPGTSDCVNWRLGPVWRLYQTENTWCWYVCIFAGCRMIYTSLVRMIKTTDSIIYPPVCDDVFGHICSCHLLKGEKPHPTTNGLYVSISCCLIGSHSFLNSGIFFKCWAYSEPIELFRILKL